jgi:hypothetical protein
VFAEFGDSRLPPQYQGDDLGPTPGGDPYALQEVQAAWNRLSTADRATLQPFFVPPAARGSWANATPSRHATSQASLPALSSGTAPVCSPLDKIVDKNWTYLDDPGGKVRIWWYKTSSRDAAAAKAIAPAIASKIWPAFTDLMHRQPLSDASEPCFHGGSGAYDIYLVNFVTAGRYGPPRALTVTYPGRCTDSPAYTLFSTSHGARPPRPWEIAHELFHAWQFSYKYAADCAQYQGFDEGAANWAAEYVYPKDEARNASWMVEGPWFGWARFDAVDGYSLWAFDLFMSKTLHDSAIPTIYDKFQSMGPLDAVDSVLPGGFQRQWPLFTRYGWNRPPGPPSFTRWDEFTRIPGCGQSWSCPTRPVNLGSLELPANLAPLSRQYYSLSVPDNNVRYLKFTNPLAGLPGASVQAYVRLVGGDWQLQKWTQTQVTFCRDQQDQNVQDIILMYSNDKPDLSSGPAVATPTMTAQSSCGPVVISGSISYLQTMPTMSTNKSSDTQTGTFKIKAASQYDPPTGTAWTSIGSSYQVKDRMHEVIKNYPDAGCTDTNVASLDASGALRDVTAQSDGQLIVFWGPTYSPNVGFGIVVTYSRTVKTTVSGPAECGHSSTMTSKYAFQPACLDQLGQPYAEPGVFGPFKGNLKTSTGTITINCSGTYADGNIYRVTGHLRVAKMPLKS